MMPSSPQGLTDVYCRTPQELALNDKVCRTEDESSDNDTDYATQCRNERESSNLKDCPARKMKIEPLRMCVAKSITMVF